MDYLNAPFLPAVHIPYIIAACEKYNVSESELLSGSDVDVSKANDANYLISINQYKALVERAIMLTEMPSIGLDVGAALTYSSYGSIGIDVYNSSTGVELVKLAIKYCQPFLPFLNIEFREEGDVSRVIYHEVFHIPGIRYFFDLILSSCYKACSLISNDVVQTAELRFTLEDSENIEPYKARFVSKLAFGCANHEFVLNSDILKMPLPQYDPVSKPSLTEESSFMLDRLNADRSVANRLRDVLTRDPDRLPALNDAAGQLNLSSRSLSRKLRDERTSYREILDSVRANLAKKYLLSSKKSMEQISYSLGFDDVSSFNRAFKRWYGTQPSQFRKTESV